MEKKQISNFSQQRGIAHGYLLATQIGEWIEFEILQMKPMELLRRMKKNALPKIIRKEEIAINNNIYIEFMKEEIVGRGFAINSMNGIIASMSSNYIWIFSPNGGLEYKLLARYEFSEDQKLPNEDINNRCIRLSKNDIFVWSFSRSRVYSFKLSYNSIILVDVIKDKYLKIHKQWM